MDSVTLMRESNYLSAQGKEVKPKCDSITVLTCEEIALLRKEAFSLNDDGTRRYLHAAAYFLMLNTGLRTGEVLGLRHSDIVIEKRALYVNRSVKQVRKRNGKIPLQSFETIIGPPKTGTSRRMIPLNDTALKMVIDLRHEVYFGEDSPLIPDENGGVLSPRTFYSRYKRMVKACGLDKTGLHILRHTFATNLVKGQKEPDGRLKTLPVKIVADLLGHTTTCITERYYVRRDNVALKGITDDFNI